MTVLVVLAVCATLALTVAVVVATTVSDAARIRRRYTARRAVLDARRRISGPDSRAGYRLTA
jgi:hypothetical protein